MISSAWRLVPLNSCISERNSSTFWKKHSFVIVVKVCQHQTGKLEPAAVYLDPLSPNICVTAVDEMCTSWFFFFFWDDFLEIRPKFMLNLDGNLASGANSTVNIVWTMLHSIRLIGTPVVWTNQELPVATAVVEVFLGCKSACP